MFFIEYIICVCVCVFVCFYINIEYRGNIKWDNNWMNFLNGVFTFLICKNMENNDRPADISTIHQICIDPSKFENCVGKGIYNSFKCTYVIYFYFYEI